MRRRAFTLVEIIVVMVVMGIVASIGAEIISKLYENYIKTRVINKLQSQTETVLDIIAKRLENRVRGSEISRREGTTSYSQPNDIRPLSYIEGSYQILEWIGRDNEGFRGESNGSVVVPGWSGFVDLDSSDTNKTNKTLKTSGSRLDFADDIIKSLSYGKVDLNATSSNHHPALFFKGSSDFNVSKYYANDHDDNNSYGHVVTIYNNSKDILHFENNTPEEIYEQYYLAWSAYAIVPEGNDDDFNLTLYYNYQPWHGKNYTDGNNSTLVEHVSTFKFTQIGETIRVKLCISDDTTGYKFALCKERSIF